MTKDEAEELIGRVGQTGDDMFELSCWFVDSLRLDAVLRDGIVMLDCHGERQLCKCRYDIDEVREGRESPLVEAIAGEVEEGGNNE